MLDANPPFADQYVSLIGPDRHGARLAFRLVFRNSFEGVGWDIPGSGALAHDEATVGLVAWGGRIELGEKGGELVLRRVSAANGEQNNRQNDQTLAHDYTFLWIFGVNDAVNEHLDGACRQHQIAS